MTIGARALMFGRDPDDLLSKESDDYLRHIAFLQKASEMDTDRLKLLAKLTADELAKIFLQIM